MAEEERRSPPMEMEDGGAEEADEPTTYTEFPVSKVKKIVKMDKDVKKVNSEAILLIRLSSQLFLRFLAEKSAEVTAEKKRKTVSLDHLRVAIRRHPPTRDFLLDCLPQPSARSSATQMKSAAATREPPPPPPAGTRRIDDFFRKPASDPQE